MSYLLDTSICVALLKNADPELHEKLRRHPPSKFSLCSVVKAELLFEARKSQHVGHKIQLLEAFFKPFTSLSFDDRAAEYYGVNRAILAKEGTPLGETDLLISSIALTNNLTVVTRNRKALLHVPGLRVETW